MCGRVAQAKNPTEYGSMLKVDFTKGIPNAPAHYNGAPGQDYMIARLRTDSDDITLDMIRWGLLPPWAKDRKMAWKMINSRAESVATAPAFKKAFEKRRCLLPVHGSFEWEKVGKERRPHMIAMLDRRPFTLAGLGRIGRTPTQANRSARLRSSPLMRTSSSPNFTTGCRLSSILMTASGG